MLPFLTSLDGWLFPLPELVLFAVCLLNFNLFLEPSFCYFSPINLGFWDVFLKDSSFLYMGRLLEGFGVGVISYTVCYSSYGKNFCELFGNCAFESLDFLTIY